MTFEVITIRGEAYLTLDALANCYEVEVSFLVAVYEVGLLGRGERVADTFAVATTNLDRLARILQLHRQQGLDVSGIASFLELAP